MTILFNLGVPDTIKRNMFFPLSVREVLSSPDMIVIKTDKGNLVFRWKFSEIYGVEKDFSGHTVSINGLVASDQIVSVDRVDQQTVRISLINGNKAFVKFEGDIETLCREDWDYDDEVLSPYVLLDINDSEDTMELPDGLWSAQTVVFIPLFETERQLFEKTLKEKEKDIRVLKNEVAQKIFLVEKTKREFLIFSFLQKIRSKLDFAYPYEFNEKIQETLKSNEGLDLDAQALRVRQTYFDLTNGLDFLFTNGKKYKLEKIEITTGRPMTHVAGIEQDPNPGESRCFEIFFRAECGDVYTSRAHIGGNTYDTSNRPMFYSLNPTIGKSRTKVFYKHQIHKILRGDHILYEDYPEMLGCWEKDFLGEILFGEQKQNFLPDVCLKEIYR